MHALHSLWHSLFELCPFHSGIPHRNRIRRFVMTRAPAMVVAVAMPLPLALFWSDTLEGVLLCEVHCGEKLPYPS